MKQQWFLLDQIAKKSAIIADIKNISKIAYREARKKMVERF